MIKDIVIPEIGEKVESGNVVAVLVAVGDQVEQDDGIIEFETDKAVVEIPSPAKGVILEVLVKEGDELRIGDPVARLDTAVETSSKPLPEKTETTETPSGEKKSRKPAPPDAKPEPPRVEDQTPDAKAAATPPPPADQTIPVPAAPSVRRFAREVGVDLRVVQGSGPGGRISEPDVKAFLKGLAKLDRPAGPTLSADASRGYQLPDFSRWGNIETVELTTVRRITAESMTQSWQTVPQVTQFDSTDISDLNQWIAIAGRTLAKTGGRLTITAVLLKVIAEGIKQFPRFNASIDMPKQQIILKNYIHVGLAVDTDRGLLVPVIRDVDHKSIRVLAGEMEDLASRARGKRLKPDEMEGGTFTVSNQGGIGGRAFTPIVYWPQAAILGVSRASVEPRHIDGDWQPRTILPLSLSYDHRINDGADAARFLRWICDALEHPMAMHF